MDDRIEISFTEEEKKSFNTENKSVNNSVPDFQSEKKPFDQETKDFPQDKINPNYINPENHIRNMFWTKYDREQKAVFSVLLVLLLGICLFCKFYIEPVFIPNGSQNGEQGNQTPEEYRAKNSIFLSKGESAAIVDENNNGLSKILVGVGWDPINDVNSRMDVDSSVILVDSSRRKTYTVYYAHKTGPGIYHHGDNLTGENNSYSLQGAMAQDDENIEVFLNQVPTNYDKIFFVLNIYRAYLRYQTLSIVQNMYINLYNPDMGQLLMSYQVTGNTPGTGLVLGVAIRGNTTYENQLPTNGQSASSLWEFCAKGDAYTVADIRDLEKICLNNY